MTDYQCDKPHTLAQYDVFKSNHGAKLLLLFDMCKKNRNKIQNDNYELAKRRKVHLNSLIKNSVADRSEACLVVWESRA